MNTAFFIVKMAEKELARIVLFLFVPSQVTETAEPLGKTSAGEIGLAFGERFQ